jgi:hypothetical protein
MTLTFQIFNPETGAFRDTDEISDDLVAEFDGILDAHESSQLSTGFTSPRWLDRLFAVTNGDK